MVITLRVARRMDEAGLILAFLGAVSVIVGAGMGISSMKQKSDRRQQERTAYLIGGVVLAIGFVLQLVAVHR